jgi:hypothetical protein
VLAYFSLGQIYELTNFFVKNFPLSSSKKIYCNESSSELYDCTDCIYFLFRSLSKGAYGIGDVVLEPLRDVWGNSRVRINNSLDNKSRPFPRDQSKLYPNHYRLFKEKVPSA